MRINMNNMNKPTVKLYSVEEGKLVDFEVSVANDEVICTYKDEFLKFPGGLTKDQFLKLVDKHNKANDGLKAVTQEDIAAQEALAKKNEKLLEDLN